MPDLRPMEFGEVLDGAFTVYRRHFGLFFKLSLLVMWLPLALSVYMRIRFAGLLAVRPDQALGLAQNEVWPLLGWALVLVLVYICGSLMLTAGSIRIISDSYLGYEPKLGTVLRFGWIRMVPLLLVSVGKGLLLLFLWSLCAIVIGISTALSGVLGVGLLTLLMLFAGIAGSIWLFLFVLCGYMVTTPVVVLETLGSSFDAFGRSWELTRNVKLRMLGFGVIAWFLITLVLPLAMSWAIGILVLELAPGAGLVWSIVSSVFPILVAPILPCVLTLAYYDRRVRHEGFDLQVLGSQLGISLTGAS